ncbi:MAG: CapA family protein [Actinomycetia bacterium]|nr:CapA family protein [Actinomycetes bacterium]
MLSGCAVRPVGPGRAGTPGATAQSAAPAASQTAGTPTRAPAAPSQRFTVSFAGDVHFMERTARRLAANPATVFDQAEPGLAAADLTMVNLETAITTRGTPQAKEFHFRTDPTALTALRDAGVDVATEANNHAVDFGDVGLADTLHAIKASGFPVIGVGANADAAFKPYTTTINGARIAVFAADQVQDETTLSLFSAGAGEPGVANARQDAPRLIAAVRAAAKAGYVTIVYLHWGTENSSCMDADQQTLATQLARAGAAAVVGSHAHVIQGSGWLPNGTYVDYGLGNFLWWEEGPPNQNDTGVLTLTFDRGKVVAARFAPARIGATGVAAPVHGAEATRINGLRAAATACSDLSPTRPS